jgi:hypothetical protein
MSKNVEETEVLEMTSQYGEYALRAGQAKVLACTHMYTPTRPGTHTYGRKHAHAHARTRKYVIILDFPPQQ